MRNFYQRPAFNHKLNFLISGQIQNIQNFSKDQHCSNNNRVTIQSNLIIAKTIKLVQSDKFYGQDHKLARDNYETSIKHNSHYNSNFNYDAEFVNIDLSGNKLVVQLLANNSATRTKKRHVNEIKNKTIRALIIDITGEKKVLVKCVGKASSKTSVSISIHFKYLASDVQTFPMKINTIILALYLFHIFPKFQKETCYVMTTLEKTATNFASLVFYMDDIFGAFNTY